MGPAQRITQGLTRLAAARSGADRPADRPPPASEPARRHALCGSTKGL